jgi:hypothetical protein
MAYVVGGEVLGPSEYPVLRVTTMLAANVGETRPPAGLSRKHVERQGEELVAGLVQGGIRFVN